MLLIIIFFQDGHEICFVGDEAFRQLSMVDPRGNELLDKVGNINAIFLPFFIIIVKLLLLSEDMIFPFCLLS